MEPFRIAVDRHVLSANYEKFESDEKHDILGLFSQRVEIEKTSQTLLNAIRIYTKSVFDAIDDKDVSKIKFARL